MNATQHEILQFIASHPNSDLPNIAANCGVDYQTAANAVYRLVLEGYVKRTSRKNTSYFTASDVGKSFVNEINS